MQEASDTDQAEMHASDANASTANERGTLVERPVASRPYLRLIVRNPGPSRLRERTAPARESGGALAERLASRWTSAFDDDEAAPTDSPATSVRQIERPLAPIVSLFPHRRP